MSLSKFELLKKDFLKNLSKEKYQLLEKLDYYSKCVSDFIFRHEDELDYIYQNLDKELLGRERLVEEASKLLDIKTDKEFIEKLTYFKLKHFSRILAKDIYKKHKLEELTEEYSYLADATLEVAYKRAFEKNKKLYGTPIEKSTDKEAKGLVIALGKYGGLDLNYYSDIDIMYIYSDEGKTTKGITNREFFISTFRDLTIYLTKRNIEGITWIVDLDLRPEGKKGLLAYSLPAIEFYYWSHGRTWERHMLIKARHGAGDKNLFNEFLEIITPFVYRKHSSSEVFEEIAEIKRIIEEEAKKKLKNGYDIKRGEGGIRSIEFTIQILQLLYGGKDKNLRERRTLKALEKLIKGGYIDKNDGELLREAYIFYRNLEHIIQVKNCVQTQFLDFKYLSEYADKMGFKSEEEFLNKLNFYRENIKRIFENLTPSNVIELTPLQKYILTKHYEEEAVEYLKQLGFNKPEWALNIFKTIFLSKAYIELSESFKDKLFMYIPKLENELKNFPDREDFLLNLSKMLIDGGLLLLFASTIEQNENVVKLILNIAKLSDYISSLISKDRELADWIFGLEDISSTKEDFEKEYKIYKSKLDWENSLRKLKNYIEIATSIQYLSEINRTTPLERLSKLNTILSDLADFILEKIYTNLDGKNFVIYSLGKLGSKEMNIGSDLDLIFAFKDKNSKLEFGYIPVKIFKLLTSYSKYGILYQVDLRLRPFGKKGELAPTLEFFKSYFNSEAKPWERLAWTKARYIAGDTELRDEFEKVIKDFLFSKPIDKEFIESIFEMRFRLEGATSEYFEEIDIKWGKGGIADIEFLAQLEILKRKIRETNILNIVKNFLPDLLDDYLFLREIEARLRMIKGLGISKISKKSPYFYRLAHSYNMENNELWNKLIETKKSIRDKFLDYFKKEK